MKTGKSSLSDGESRTFYVKHENDTGGESRTFYLKYENDTGVESPPEQTELHEVLDGVVLVAADGGPGERYLDGLKAAIDKDAGFWKVLLLSQHGGGFTMTWNAWREVLEKYAPGYLPYFYRSGHMDECGAYTLAGAIAADSSDKPEYLKDFLAFLREGAFRVLINHNPTREITQEWLEGVK